MKKMITIVIMMLFLTIFESYAIKDVYKDVGNENWTSCTEFLANSTFDVNSVIDVDWKIFYFWNEREEKSYNIRFSIANPTLIDRFKVELRNIGSAVNWSQAILFMETSIDFSALYITTETPGKFILVPSFAFQLDEIPLLVFALKIVEPGYLGIINCQYRLCYALAPVDKLPKESELTTAAEKIGFKGDYNRSYLYHSDVSNPPEPESDEDLQLEIDKESFDDD